ncbi:MAG: hypothetical protein MJZ09_05640 [Bacteroidales bacterium]|nr:hypothetical protein [Bacteroidales bacterium]
MKEYVIKESHERRCLECGDELDGRADMKFCSCECKNRYNNRRSHRQRATRNKINSILEKNHDILDGLLRMGVRSLDLVSLTRMGYVMMYNTASTRTRGRAELWCYDIRFCLSETRIFNIERVELP